MGIPCIPMSQFLFTITRPNSQYHLFPGTEFNILGFRLKRSSFCSTNLDFIFQRTLEKFFPGFLIFGLLIIFILLLRKSVQLTRKTLNSAQRNWTRSLSEIARTK